MNDFSKEQGLEGNQSKTISLDLNTIYQYVENQLSDSEREEVEGLIGQDEMSISLIGSMMRLEEQPISEAEKEEARKLLKRDAETQVARIVELANEQASAEKASDSSKSQTAEIIPFYTRPAVWGTAIAASLLIFFGLKPLFDNQQASSLTNMAFSQATQQSTYYQNPRFSAPGDKPYGVSVVGKLLGSNDDAPYQKIKTNLEASLDYNPNQPEVKRILAQVYLKLGEDAKADSLQKDLLAADYQSARLYNDLGVVAYGKKDWHTAERHFLKALQIDPALNEARYNLGITYQQLEIYDKAVTSFDEFQLKETRHEWKAAAAELIRQINDRRAQENDIQ